MKVLFCCPCEVDRKLGAAGVTIGLADALERQGWTCKVIGPSDIDATAADYPEKLHAHLRQHASSFDVVDFDYDVLRFKRSDFGPEVLMVARAQLLRHHHLFSPLPPASTAGDAYRLVKYAYFRHRKRVVLPQNDASFKAADLVTVSNEKARTTLAERGISPNKMLVFPNGMDDAQRRAYDLTPVAIPPGEPRLGFIGAFGYRKGAADMPDVFRRIVRAIPDVRFRLLGTRRNLKTADAVLARFPARIRPYMEVIPTYEPGTLPDLLAPCAAGFFPSYAEGFPLGILEMLAAAMPVIAYDAPGMSEMLPPEDLVPPTDTKGMAEKLVALLTDEPYLAARRRWARVRAHSFNWDEIAQRVSKAYTTAVQQHRNGHAIQAVTDADGHYHVLETVSYP